MNTTKAACWSAAAGAVLVLTITIPAFVALSHRPAVSGDTGALGLIIIAMWPMLLLQNAESILRAYGFSIPLNFMERIGSTGSQSTDLFVLISFNAAFGAVTGLMIYFTCHLLCSGIRLIRKN